MPPLIQEIIFLGHWKLAPLTKVHLNLGDEYVYVFHSIKKGSTFKFTAINEENDLGGFTTVAYKVECQFIPVQVITNYVELIDRCRVYGVHLCRFYFGEVQSTGYQFFGTAFNFDDVTVKDFSIETLEVETSDANFETAIKVTFIASVDLLSEAGDYFIQI